MNPDHLTTLPPEQTIELLLREETPDSLNQLEGLLDKGDITHEMVLSQLIYNWADHRDDTTEVPLPEVNRRLYIQYEGLRDGDQIGVPGVRRLSTRLDVAKMVFPHLPAFGVTVADLGMPISGKPERDKILDMVGFIADNNIPITPAVAGRTHPDDVSAITELARYSYDHFGQKLLVYAFVGSSRIRRLAEGQEKWNLPSITSWLANTVDTLKKEPSVSRVIVPFEDTYGAFPEDIMQLSRAALETGADGICICDTVSRGYRPEWTRKLIRYIGHRIAPDYPKAIWEIHTHNMQGDAVTNAAIAFREGLITGVHGTLGGVGDLGGNMPIEQFILHRIQDGSHPDRIELQRLRELTNTVLTARNIVPAANPFIGSIYSKASRVVPTGIHASAFRRLTEVGPHMQQIFEHVYFPYSPTSLGLEIHLDAVTPVSGASNVIAKAQKMGVSDRLKPEVIKDILAHARQKGEPLADDEFLGHFPGTQETVVFESKKV